MEELNLQREGREEVWEALSSRVDPCLLFLHCCWAGVAPPGSWQSLPLGLQQGQENLPPWLGAHWGGSVGSTCRAASAGKEKRKLKIGPRLCLHFPAEKGFRAPAGPGSHPRALRPAPGALRSAPEGLRSAPGCLKCTPESLNPLPGGLKPTPGSLDPISGALNPTPGVSIPSQGV